MMTGLAQAILGAVLLGAANTLGDFLWDRLELRHSIALGVAHGAVLLLCVGLYLGALARRPVAGAAGGVAAGVIGACVFYALAPVMRMSAMFPAWVALWIIIGLMDGVVLRKGRAVPALTRGLMAALASGLAFYAISGIWLNPSPEGPRYLVHFASWTFAFFPGFLALLAGRR